jgi:hypothetical protein
MLRLFKGGAVSLHACMEGREEPQGKEEEEEEEEEGKLVGFLEIPKTELGSKPKKTLLKGASESWTLAGM